MEINYIHVLYLCRNGREILKGQCHEIFDHQFFSLNCSPGSPDSWAKTVLHIDSNSWRSSAKIDDKNQLRALPHSAESIFFC
jgi:hypothetical protein